MPDYVKLAKTANRLIAGALGTAATKKNSRSVTLFKASRAPLDPAKPWRGMNMEADPSTSTDGGKVTVSASFVPARGTGFGRDYNDREQEALKDVEQFALIPALAVPAGVDLGEFDSMLDGGKVWRVVFVGLLRPGSVGLVWEVGVAK